jgi:hypothetical protein
MSTPTWQSTRRLPSNSKKDVEWTQSGRRPDSHVFKTHADLIIVEVHNNIGAVLVYLIRISLRRHQAGAGQDLGVVTNLCESTITIKRSTLPVQRLHFVTELPSCVLQYEHINVTMQSTLDVQYLFINGCRVRSVMTNSPKDKQARAMLSATLIIEPSARRRKKGCCSVALQVPQWAKLGILGKKATTKPHNWGLSKTRPVATQNWHGRRASQKLLFPRGTCPYEHQGSPTSCTSRCQELTAFTINPPMLH